MATKASQVEGLLKSDAALKEGGTAKATEGSKGTEGTKEVSKAVSPDVSKEPIPVMIQAPKLSQDSLENIVATQKQLSDVKKSLGTIIETVSQNPSIITRVATAYGELPLWKKLAYGLGLTIPTLAAGIFAHIGGLLVISGVTGVGYTYAGILLDDHHHCNVSIAERLKAGIFSLSDVLELTIGALDTIRKQLAAEIEKFKAENLKLASHVSKLGDQLASLGPQVELFAETEKSLFATKNKLEASIASMKETEKDQAELLQQYKTELAQITKDHQKSQDQLSEKMLELTQVKIAMAKEVSKAQKVTATLQGVVSTMAGTAIAEKEQREAFQAKLDGFLSEGEATLDKVADRISGAERELLSVKAELQVVKSELNSSLDTHKALIEEQARQVDRLKAIKPTEPAKSPTHKVVLSVGKENPGVANRNRFYTPVIEVSGKHDLTTQPGQEVQMVV